jgi:hypothetical protein
MAPAAAVFSWCWRFDTPAEVHVGRPRWNLARPKPLPGWPQGDLRERVVNAGLRGREAIATRCQTLLYLEVR